MKEQTPSENNPRMPHSRRNYVILLIGFVTILVGFALMAGSGSHSAEEFNEAIFSWRRITLAPIVIVAGFAIEIYGILKRY